MIEATLKYTMITTAASCTVVMFRLFTVYSRYADPGIPSDWNRALRVAKDLFVYPFILWSDVQARILIGDHLWATVLIGSEGKPVVQDAYGVAFTVEVLDKQAEKQEGEQ